jgi:hypothetical protein
MMQMDEHPAKLLSERKGKRSQILYARLKATPRA